MRKALQAPTSPVLLVLFTLGCSDGASLPGGEAGPLAPNFSNVGMGPPLTGGGSGTMTSLEITSSRTAGNNVIQERRIEGTIEGALQGTFVERARGVIHGTGLVTYRGTFEFTGTVEGCEGEGTLVAALSGTGQAGLPVTEATFRVIQQGTGTLRVAGTGNMSQVGPAFTYDLRYVCR